MYTTVIQMPRRGSRGGEMGEFSAPFFWASFFLFFSFFSYPSTRLWLYYIVTKIHPPFQNPGSAPVSLCLSYAWAVFHYLLFQRGKHERKHKKNENIWSYCLCLYLRLCQGRSYSTLLQSCGICYPHELEIPNKLGRKSADEDLICCQGNFIALF